MDSHYEDGYSNPAFSSHSSPPRCAVNVSQSAQENNRYGDVIVCHVPASRRAMDSSRNAHENHGYDDSSSPPRRIISSLSSRHGENRLGDVRIQHISSPRRIIYSDQDTYDYEDSETIPDHTPDNGHDNICYEDSRSSYDHHNSPSRRVLNSSRNVNDSFCYEDSNTQHSRGVTSPLRNITITSYSGHDNLCYGDNISGYDHHVTPTKVKMNTSFTGRDNYCFDDSRSPPDRQISPSIGGMDTSQDSEESEYYENSSVDTVQTVRIAPREPPIGAATVSRIVDVIPKQGYDSRITRIVSSPVRHRRHDSMPSPSTSRRLLHDYSPPRIIIQRQDHHQQRMAINRRHSVHVPRNNKSGSSAARQSQMVSALTSPQQTRRISREISPPKSGVSRQLHATTPNKPKLITPEFNESPRSNQQQSQQQKNQHHDTSISTPQKVKPVSESPSRFSRLISPFSTPKKNNPASSITENAPTTPPKVGKLISPLTTPQKSDPSSLFITANRNNTTMSRKKNGDSSKRSSTMYVMPDAEAGRNTAVVSPIYPDSCTEPRESPPPKSSWIQLSSAGYQTPPTGTLATVGIILTVCGAVTLILGLYLLSVEGRRYYLDFGLLSGGLYLLLGALAFRARRWQWLPNRNYVSGEEVRGYIVVSMFSVLTCTGLAVIASLRPQAGTALADLLGGGVCGVAVLTIFLSALGIVMSQCCRTPPPDNRVEHSAEGFTL